MCDSIIFSELPTAVTFKCRILHPNGPSFYYVVAFKTSQSTRTDHTYLTMIMMGTALFQGHWREKMGHGWACLRQTSQRPLAGTEHLRPYCGPAR